MIPEQRRRDILQYLESQSASSFATLSDRYGVSEMTIRRDLRALEGGGRVKVTHGGALYVQQAIPEPPYAVKEHRNIALKTQIAQYAAQHFVQDDDVIALEAGTTVGALVPFLVGKQNLTIVTNGLRTTNLLHAHIPEALIICTGGILRGVSGTFVGPTAEQFFRAFHVRTVFLSGIGLTPDAGLTDPQLIDTQVKKAMINAAERTILMMDSTKLGVHSMVQVMATDQITTLLTDHQASPEMVAEFRQRNIQVHVT